MASIKAGNDYAWGATLLGGHAVADDLEPGVKAEVSLNLFNFLKGHMMKEVQKNLDSRTLARVLTNPKSGDELFQFEMDFKLGPINLGLALAAARLAMLQVGSAA